MNNSELKIIASIFDKEIEWLDKIIQRRFDLFYNRGYTPTVINNQGEKVVDYSKKAQYEPIKTIAPFDFPNDHTNYSNFITNKKLSFDERLLLVLSLVPHLKPEFLLKAFKEEINKLPQIGLIMSQKLNCLVPTGLTFLFIAGGSNIEQRLNASCLLRQENLMLKEKVIHIEPTQSGDPMYSGTLILSHTYFELFISPVQNIALINYLNEN